MGLFRRLVKHPVRCPRCRRRQFVALSRSKVTCKTRGCDANLVLGNRPEWGKERKVKEVRNQ